MTIEDERYDIANLSVYKEEAIQLGKMLHDYYVSKKNLISDISIRHDNINVHYYFMVMCKDNDDADFCIDVTIMTVGTYYKFLMRWKDENK